MWGSLNAFVSSGLEKLCLLNSCLSSYKTMSTWICVTNEIVSYQFGSYVQLHDFVSSRVRRLVLSEFGGCVTWLELRFILPWDNITNPEKCGIDPMIPISAENSLSGGRVNKLINSARMTSGSLDCSYYRWEIMCLSISKSLQSCRVPRHNDANQKRALILCAFHVFSSEMDSLGSLLTKLDPISSL